MNGKGYKPRSGFNSKYRKNYDAILWKPKCRYCGGRGEVLHKQEARWVDLDVSDVSGHMEPSVISLIPCPVCSTPKT